MAVWSTLPLVLREVLNQITLDLILSILPVVHHFGLGQWLACSFGDSLDMSTLTPHGACLEWKPELIWVNAVSDAMVAVAFFATAFLLGYFVWRRHRDMRVMFRFVFWAFAIFATGCAATRLLSILVLWVPAYGIEAAVKGVMAPVAATIAAGL